MTVLAVRLSLQIRVRISNSMSCCTSASATVFRQPRDSRPRFLMRSRRVANWCADWRIVSEHLLDRDRQRADPRTRRVIDGVGDRGHHPDDGEFPDTFLFRGRSLNRVVPRPQEQHEFVPTFSMSSVRPRLPMREGGASTTTHVLSAVFRRIDPWGFE